MSEGRFKVGDRVRMVDGMEGRLLNSWGMMFEWGVVKEVEGNEVRVGFWKDGMERVEYWCLEGQLERVERGASRKCGGGGREKFFSLKNFLFLNPGVYVIGFLI